MKVVKVCEGSELRFTAVLLWNHSISLYTTQPPELSSAGFTGISMRYNKNKKRWVTVDNLVWSFRGLGRGFIEFYAKGVRPK